MMDFINLPLVLVILCAIGFVTWIIDIFVWKKDREAAITNLQGQYPNRKVRGTEDKKAYKKAVKDLKVEPGLVKEIRAMFPIVLIVTVVRSFIVEPFQIPSSSMEPTLDIGDFILVNKYTYGIRLPVIRTKILDIKEPKTGDVMVFFPPNDKRYFIKRVIGVPGDVIEYKGKVLTINGVEQPLEQLAYNAFDPYRRKLYDEDLKGVVHKTFIIPSRPIKDFKETVKSGHYFMMGDNRDNSSDSRVWGQVSEDNIVGRAYAVWMHWAGWTSFPEFSKARWIK